MTEAEWLECRDPQPMLEFLQGKASDRKLRLFACSCCRRVRRRLADPRSRTAIEVLGQFADASASEADLRQAHESAWAALTAIQDDANEQRWYYADEAAAQAVCEACTSNLRLENVLEVALRTCDSVVFAEEEVAGTLRRRVRSVQADCLREIFGNPFRPVNLRPSLLAWRAGKIVKMAQDVYQARDFENMSVLADALEDAGCANPDVLDHLRGPIPHVRGCWVLDLLLAKQ